MLGGRYELTRLLGEGGEASVYAARDRSLGREVAVKLFRRQVAPPSAGALEQVEARVGAALNHYALTTLIDTGIDVGPDGAPQLYLVMEYVPGETLRERLSRGAMEVSEVCWMGFDLAEGLDYMHQTGFLHRDVKPSNILLSGLRSVRPVIAKLTDFGIAAPVGEPDLSEFTVGTAAYLSPEQVEGLDARPESDVYSLGLVMLEAMTGRTEFRGSVTEAAFERLTRDPRIPPSIPPRTAALLRRMTARVPGDRIGLHDVAVELQQILVDDLQDRRDQAARTRPNVAEPDDLRAAMRQGPADADAVLRLVSAATEAPKALLLLVEADRREVIGGAQGWAQRPSGIEARPFQPSRAAARTWALPDVFEDPALAGHPLLAEPHDVRAAAGTALVAPDGGRLGTLLVADGRRRPFTEAQLRALEDAGDLIVREAGLRAAVRRALFPSG